MKVRISILFLIIPIFIGYGQSLREDTLHHNLEIIKGSINLVGWYNLGIGSNGTLNVSLILKDNLIKGLNIKAEITDLKIDTTFYIQHKKNNTVQPLLLGPRIDTFIKISLTESFCEKGGKLEIKVFIDKKKYIEHFFILPNKKEVFVCFHQNTKSEQLNLIDKIILNLKGSIYNRSKIRPKEYFIIPSEK